MVNILFQQLHKVFWINRKYAICIITKLDRCINLGTQPEKSHQYLLEPPFAKITASRRLLWPLMSVWILDEGILDHSSLQNISSSVRFDGCLARTARFNSSHRFSIIFKSGDWDGHSRTLYSARWLSG